jgi:hypothetical protein
MMVSTEISQIIQQIPDNPRIDANLTQSELLSNAVYGPILAGARRKGLGRRRDPAPKSWPKPMIIASSAI